MRTTQSGKSDKDVDVNEDGDSVEVTGGGYPIAA